MTFPEILDQLNKNLLVKLDSCDDFVDTLLTSEKIEKLADALKKNTSLQSLRFSGQIFKDKFFRELIEAISLHPNLTQIAFDDCELGNAEVEILLPYLSNHPKIEDVSLYGNHIGSKGLIMLANVVENNSKIRKMNISDNNYRDSGLIKALQAFSGALANNTTLTYLDFTKIYIPKESRQIFINALSENTTLTTLMITDVYLSTGEKEAIEKQIDINNKLASMLDGNYFHHVKLHNEFSHEISNLLKMKKPSQKHTIALPTLFDLTANVVLQKRLVGSKSVPTDVLDKLSSSNKLGIFKQASIEDQSQEENTQAWHIRPKLH